MKILQVLVQAMPPFSDFQVEFAYPEGHEKAGKPLDRICLIGGNGTGKSSLLKLIGTFLKDTLRFRSKSLFLVKIEIDGRRLYAVHINNNGLLFKEEIDEEPMWMFELIRDQAITLAFTQNYEKYCIGHEEEPELYDKLWFENDGNDLVIFQPSDYYRDFGIGLNGVPPVKGHEAESLVGNFPFYNEVSPAKLTDFWAMLGFLFYRRNRTYQDFCGLKENTGKPESILKNMFDKEHPEIIPSLKAAWTPVLDELGVEINDDELTIPINIRDKFVLVLKEKGSGKKIEFGELGTGLRRMLFNLGHIWALSFDREIAQSFVFLEEPEANLHPSFIKQLVPLYENIVQSNQLFVSTHSPILAASFDPAERLILEKDEAGQISIRRSECAIDASYSEILEKDFS